MAPAAHVGTLGEKHLHAALKRHVAQPGDQVEVPLDGFVIDLVRGSQLIEVQTRGFAGMRRKLDVLLDSHPIHIIHPVAAHRWILKVSDDGELLSTRKSPKRGHVTDVFAELVSFPSLVDHPNLTIEVVMTHEHEVRRHEPGRAWRRKGWVVHERRLVEVVQQVPLCNVSDLAGLLPAQLPTRFGTADLADALGRPRRIAQQMAYCLRIAEAIRQVDKDGNAAIYERSR